MTTTLPELATLAPITPPITFRATGDEGMYEAPTASIPGLDVNTGWTPECGAVMWFDGFPRAGAVDPDTAVAFALGIIAAAEAVRGAR